MSTKTDTGTQQHTDPVCHMQVADDSPLHHLYKGTQYYFCSEHCLHKFKAQPEQYLDNKTPPPHSIAHDSTHETVHEAAHKATTTGEASQ